MGRQLFLHHYLPAHLASALVTGALVEFIFCADPLEKEVIDKDGKKTYVAAPKRSLVGAWIACGVISAAVVACFIFYAPLTYGTPGLTVEQVLARKFLGYELHFAK